MSLTLVIIAVTCLISFQAFNNLDMKRMLVHNPYLENHKKEYYRLLTHGFIHGDQMHLFVNMFVLWGFGTSVENQFLSMFGPVQGRIIFLLMYLITIVAASLSTHFKHKDNPHYSALGASGATSGIMFSFIIFQPWATLLLFLVIPCPAIIAAVLYLVYSSWASKKSRDNIGHEAHFYGAVFGFLFTIAVAPEQILEFVERLKDVPFL